MNVNKKTISENAVGRQPATPAAIRASAPCSNTHTAKRLEGTVEITGQQLA